MKKLMIAVAIVCAAVASQAAQFAWGGMDVMSGHEGGDGKGVNGTAYLIWDNATSGLTYSGAQEILANWAAGTVADLSGITGKAYPDTAEVVDGMFENTTREGLNGGVGDYYTLIVENETGWAYLSTEVPVDSLNPYGVSAEIFFLDETTRSAGGTGWYTQAVPEPTSGLLLLLGVAGLALRRRRA